MSKTIIGIDIGASQVKFAACEAGRVRRLAAAPVPDQLVREGRIVSYEAMSAFLKETAAKLKLPGRKCAVVLPSALAFSRRTVMPAMTTDQLALNLPYEFRDYITQEKDKYVYDYAVLGMERDEGGAPVQMELMAAAALKTTVRDYADMLRRAGFKLAVAAPEEFAYYNLIRAYEAAHPDQAGRERCIIDLGHSATRIYLFTGVRFEVSRTIDYGGAMVDAAIADALHVDEHVAATYKQTDYEGALELDGCLGVYRSIATDIMRAVNFYHYNSPDSTLNTAWLCGGGARNAALTAYLRQSVSLDLRDIAELLPPGGENEADLVLCPAAAGITQQ